MSLFLVIAKIGLKFILSVSNFRRQHLKSFNVVAVVSLFVKLFHAIAPLKLMEFLLKFVSGLGRIMSSFLLQPDFLCINRSLNSVMVKPFIHLKTNSVSHTLYFVSRLSHPVRVNTSLALVSHGNP